MKKIRFVRSHVGVTLNHYGLNQIGKRIAIPALLRNGNEHFATFMGFIDARECDFMQRVKLLGFTCFSADDGRTWTQWGPHTCVIGIRKWDEYYVVLFDGAPKTLPYPPKLAQRYHNNVVPLSDPANSSFTS